MKNEDVCIINNCSKFPGTGYKVTLCDKTFNKGFWLMADLALLVMLVMLEIIFFYHLPNFNSLFTVL
jgi:hypothetical protein